MTPIIRGGLFSSSSGAPCLLERWMDLGYYLLGLRVREKKQHVVSSGQVVDRRSRNSLRNLRSLMLQVPLPLELGLKRSLLPQGFVDQEVALAECLQGEDH